MKPFNRATKCLTLALLLICAGCRVPAQIVWSPDGATAAYRIEDRAYLIDAGGKIVTSLGTVLGGFAWSADSKTLYFASSSELADPVVAPDTAWSSPERPIQPPEPAAPTTAPTSRPTKFVEVQALAGGKATSLVKFAAGDAMHMALSPDQKWLAIVCDTDAAATFSVYILHLPDKHLYLLSGFAGFGMCFTGPNRLAYIEPDRIADKADNLTGKVVEVTLNAGAAKLDRTALFDVLPGETPYLAALGENLLVTSVSRSFPGKPIADDDKRICKLYLWTRANCGIVSIADEVGPLFAVSPDGQRVLIEKISPKTDQSPAKRELQVVRTNGSDGHMLRDLSKHDAFALWPAWRGNSEITFTAPEEDAEAVTVDGQNRLQYEVIHYRLNGTYDLEPITKLSEPWKTGMRPYVVIQDVVIQGGPTTKMNPTSQPTTKE